MTPEVVRGVIDLMAGFGRPWALCGGWAVDAWVGRQTREHLDIDVAIDAADQLALGELLADDWLLNGHDPFDDDSTTPWDGHRLALPAHVHARGHNLELDFQLERRVGDSWVFRDEPLVAVPLSHAVLESSWGVPTLAPEIVLLYKSSGDIRPHDESDFRALLPTLDTDRRGWLHQQISMVDAGHRWLADLASSGPEGRSGRH